jgi:hypothetical protein
MTVAQRIRRAVDPVPYRSGIQKREQQDMKSVVKRDQAKDPNYWCYQMSLRGKACRPEDLVLEQDASSAPLSEDTWKEHTDEASSKNYNDMSQAERDHWNLDFAMRTMLRKQQYVPPAMNESNWTEHTDPPRSIYQMSQAELDHAHLDETMRAKAWRKQQDDYEAWILQANKDAAEKARQDKEVEEKQQREALAALTNANTESDLQADKNAKSKSADNKSNITPPHPPTSGTATTAGSAGKSADNPVDLQSLPANLRRTITRLREGKKISLSRALCGVVQKQPQLFTEKIRQQYLGKCKDAGYYNDMKNGTSESNGGKPDKSNDKANYAAPSKDSATGGQSQSSSKSKSSSSSTELPLAITSIGAIGGLAGLVYGYKSGLDPQYMVGLGALTLYCAWTVWTRIQDSKTK